MLNFNVFLSNGDPFNGSNFLSFVHLDFPKVFQAGFQDPSSPVMEEIINFHNYVMIYLAFILSGVF